VAAPAASIFDRRAIGAPSREQHRRSRALVLVASINPQFAADRSDERPNDRHSQAFAGGTGRSPVPSLRGKLKPRPDRTLFRDA